MEVGGGGGSVDQLKMKLSTYVSTSSKVKLGLKMTLFKACTLLLGYMHLGGWVRAEFGPPRICLIVVILQNSSGKILLIPTFFYYQEILSILFLFTSVLKNYLLLLSLSRTAQVSQLLTFSHEH